MSLRLWKHLGLWTHEVRAATPSGSRTILQAQAFDPGNPWPPGPPLSEMELTSIGDNQVALLLGQAGDSHWSASIEAVPSRPMLRFDIAVRLGRPPERLCSEYVISGGRLVWVSKRRAVVSCGEALVALVRGIVGGEQVPFLRCGAGVITIGIDPSTQGYPRTARWRYLVTLAARRRRGWKGTLARPTWEQQ